MNAPWQKTGYKIGLTGRSVHIKLLRRITISEIKPGEGVKNLNFTEDTLSVDELRYRMWHKKNFIC